MSSYDLNDVIAHTRFGFLKYARNKVVAAEGEPCQNLLFLLHGQLSVISRADDHNYTVIEQTTAPALLQPERIFGLTQRYTRTFTAATTCNLIRLSKAETLRLADQYEIFRLNLLNIISTQSQKLMRQPWRTPPSDIQAKIIRFINDRCLYPAGPKAILIKMDTMAHLIGESRLNLSRQLNLMDQLGIIQLNRGSITVPALERLR